MLRLYDYVTIRLTKVLALSFPDRMGWIHLLDIDFHPLFPTDSGKGCSPEGETMAAIIPWFRTAEITKMKRIEHGIIPREKC